MFISILDGNILQQMIASVITMAGANSGSFVQLLHKNLIRHIDLPKTVFQILLIVDQHGGIAFLRIKDPRPIQQKILTVAFGLQTTVLIVGLPIAIGLSVTQCPFRGNAIVGIPIYLIFSLAKDCHR